MSEFDLSTIASNAEPEEAALRQRFVDIIAANFPADPETLAYVGPSSSPTFSERPFGTDFFQEPAEMVPAPLLPSQGTSVTGDTGSITGGHVDDVETYDKD